VAVDDAHNFKQPGNPDVAGPGRGWVVVRAPRLEARPLVDAMERGDFYASTGVELSEYQADAQRIAIAVKATPFSKYRIQFLGKAGRLLREVAELKGSYDIRGDEGYVRTRVIESNGRMAWTQPIVARGRTGERSRGAMLFIGLGILGSLVYWRRSNAS
jgi:hypothetical protein